MVDYNEFQDDSVKHFKTLLDSMGIPVSQFKVKSAFYPKAGERLAGINPTDRIIGLYDSEAEKGVDIYMELYNKDKSGVITPLEGRPLYRYKYREDYKDIYPWNGKSYAIRVQDLEIVNQITATEMGRPNTSLLSFDDMLNAPIQRTPAPTVASMVPVASPAKTVEKTVKDLTVKELAALLWRMPISGNAEIDGLIKYYK